MDRTIKFLLASLTSNAAFAVYHLLLGLYTSSWWLLTLASYYFVLSLVRYVVLRFKAKEHFILKFTGWMLIILTVPLGGTVILSVVQDRGHVLHMIVMIAMAAYAFTKITLAIIKLFKARQNRSAMLMALRNLSLADAFVSIFALQRSMLVSFEGMSETEIVIMNAALGSLVAMVCFSLGLMLLRNDRRKSQTQSMKASPK